MIDWTRHLPYWIALALLLTGLGFLLRAWRTALVDKAEMQQAIRDGQKIIEQSQRAMSENRDNAQKQIDDLREALRKVRTPEQAARQLPTLIPGLQPQPVVIPWTLPPGAERAAVPSTGLPEPRTSDNSKTPPAQEYKITAEEVTKLYQFGEKCQECEVNLTAAQADRRELVRQMQALEEQRNSAVKAAKGGSFIQRLKRDGKIALFWSVVGGATGYALAHR